MLRVLGFGLIVMLIGMVVVFVGLLLLILFIKIMSRITAGLDREKAQKAGAA